MRRTLSLFLTLVMALGILTSVPVTVSAASSGTCGENLTWTFEDGTLTISGTGEMEDYFDFPSPWNDIDQNIKTIIIQPGVTRIGECAFVGCVNLTSIEIPDSVIYIGCEAFSNCRSLTSIKIPDSVTFIDTEAFFKCRSLTSIKIPSSITQIKGSTFENCESLASIEIPSCVTRIWRDAFYNTAYYNDSSKWENDVLYIGDYLIDANETLSGGYEIKNGTKIIADYAFYCCENLTSITIPDSVTSIGEDTFSNCKKLKNVTIPGSVTSTGRFAFAGCERITSVTILDGVECIAHATFGGCKKLTSIIIPDSVRVIEESAFYDCEKLKYVFYEGSQADWSDVKIGAPNTTLLSANIHYNATGHSESDWITDKKASAKAAGSKHKECTTCKAVLETAKIDQLKCAKPTLKKISNTTSGVKITWNTVDGADSYAVYRKTGSKGKYSKIGTATKTGFTDKKAKSGKKYYYYVKAVNEAGSSSASSSKSIYYLADTTLKTPKSTKSGVTLNWTQITGADGYMVYRKTGSGDYKKIATVKGVKKVKYTDKSAKKGKTYTYKIKAYKSKTYSAYSNAKKIKDKY